MRKPQSDQSGTVDAADREDGTVLPTEVIPVETAPMRATSAVNRGATGLDDLTAEAAAERSRTSTDDDFDRTIPTMVRHHPLAAGIAVGSVAVVLVAGLTAWAVGTAVSSSLASQNAAFAPATTATPVPESGAATVALHSVVRATILSVSSSGSSSTWSVVTKAGRTVSVAVGPSTQFGTKRVAESEGQFGVGDSVVIVVTRSDNTVTAIRVVEAGALASSRDSGWGAGSGVSTPAPTSTATS